MRIERILAPNPSIYTGPGTNTYLIEDDGETLVLDPGPIIPAHRDAILLAVADLRPVGVVATHTHPDHAPLSNPLARHLDVPVYGHAHGPEFDPDVRLDDGDELPFGGNAIVAVHTPGHTADHLCFRLGETLFTGDHIMQGSTVVMEDAAAYLESLYKVRELAVTRIEPGHGHAIDDAGSVIDEYIEHRIQRERQIVEAVRTGASTIDEIVDAVYREVPEVLRPAAAHQLGVQLEKLVAEGEVEEADGGWRVGSGSE